MNKVVRLFTPNDGVGWRATMVPRRLDWEEAAEKEGRVFQLDREKKPSIEDLRRLGPGVSEFEVVQNMYCTFKLYGIKEAFFLDYYLLYYEPELCWYRWRLDIPDVGAHIFYRRIPANVLNSANYAGSEYYKSEVHARGWVGGGDEV